MADKLIEDYLRNSQFVVAGRVERIGVTTMSMAPSAPNAGVFKIDEILHGPPVLNGFAGKEITVMFNESAVARAGESAVLFARSWLYGESLAVIEVGRMEAKEREIMRTEIDEAHHRLADEHLLQRIALAELVIVGKVIKTGPAPDDVRRRMPITEHNPDWWIAEIEVASVEKGRHKDKLVTIWFPNSEDVAWHDSPRFKPGQEGIWILQRDQQERGWPIMRVPGLTALHPLDFQPLERREHIHTLIERSAGGPPPR